MRRTCIASFAPRAAPESRLSPAESIDAMNAVADVGVADRGILRDALLLTLAKSEQEKQALADCFDVFFSQPESTRRRPGS